MLQVRTGKNSTIFLWKCFKRKKYKKTKLAHSLEGFFNSELQLRGTESIIKGRLLELLTQLKGFKFVTTLVLVFKKIESEDKKSMALFVQTQMQEYLSINGCTTWKMCFNQSILQLYQKYKNL